VYRAAHVPRLMRELKDLAARFKSGEVIVYNQLVTAYNQLHTMTNTIQLDVELVVANLGLQNFRLIVIQLNCGIGLSNSNLVSRPVVRS
jgi:hypothetical protein